MATVRPEMMPALYSRLIDAPALAALFGERISWIERPRLTAQGDGFPALTLTEISPGIVYTHDGPRGLEQARVQFDTWSASLDEQPYLVRAVRDVMETPVIHDGIAFSIGRIVNRRQFQPEYVDGPLTIYRTATDFQFYHDVA